MRRVPSKWKLCPECCFIKRTSCFATRFILNKLFIFWKQTATSLGLSVECKLCLREKCEIFYRRVFFETQIVTDILENHLIIFRAFRGLVDNGDAQWTGYGRSNGDCYDVPHLLVCCLCNSHNNVSWRLSIGQLHPSVFSQISMYLCGASLCKCPAEQRLHWERKEKRIPGQSKTSSIGKSLSEASFGLMGWGEVK